MSFITNYKIRDSEIKISQEEKSLPEIALILQIIEPQYVIEFGSGKFGGSALFFSQWLPNSQIISFDKREVDDKVFSIIRGFELKDSYIRMKGNIVYVRQDIFSDSDVMHRLKHFLSDRTVTKLLFCDDGNKIREVNTFAPLLSIGDYLAIHDWDIEIHFEDVKEALLNFRPVFFDRLKRFHIRFFEKTKTVF